MSPPSQVPTPAERGGGGEARPAQRRPYSLREYRLIAALYPHHSAANVAARLGRTRQSLYAFLTRHPELRKQGRP